MLHVDPVKATLGLSKNESKNLLLGAVAKKQTKSKKKKKVIKSEYKLVMRDIAERNFLAEQITSVHEMLGLDEPALLVRTDVKKKINVRAFTTFGFLKGGKS